MYVQSIYGLLPEEVNSHEMKSCDAEEDSRLLRHVTVKHKLVGCMRNLCLTLALKYESTYAVYVRLQRTRADRNDTRSLSLSGGL